MGILSFLIGNFKWVAILGIILALSGGAWKYTNMIKKLSIAEQTIAQQEKVIKNREITIRIERSLRDESERTLKEVQDENELLNTALENVTVNLPSDAVDLAPESLRETLRRMRNQ